MIYNMKVPTLQQLLSRRLAKIDLFPLTSTNLKNGELTYICHPEGHGFSFALRLQEESFDLQIESMAASFPYELLGSTATAVANQLIVLVCLLANGQISILTRRLGMHGRPFAVELLISEGADRKQSVAGVVNFALGSRHRSFWPQSKRVEQKSNYLIHGLAKVPEDFFLFQPSPLETQFAPVHALAPNR
jgi:hypothetical protein